MFGLTRAEIKSGPSFTNFHITVYRYRDGIEIKPDDRHVIDIRGNFAALIMKDIQPDDDAEYSITATNSTGKATSKCELFVNPLGKLGVFSSNYR